MTELHGTKMIYIFQHTLELALFSIKNLQGIEHQISVQYEGEDQHILCEKSRAPSAGSWAEIR